MRETARYGKRTSKKYVYSNNFARLSLLRSVALQRLSPRSRVGEVRKTYLAHKKQSRFGKHTSITGKRVLFIWSEKDREVRKTYLDYRKACAIYLERERPRGTETVPQKICVQHIILLVLVY